MDINHTAQAQTLRDAILGPKPVWVDTGDGIFLLDSVIEDDHDITVVLGDMP